MLKNKGFSFIELLIAAFILSFGLLGIVAVYLQSFKRTTDSYYQTIAFSCLTSIKDQGDCSKFSMACDSLLPHLRCEHDFEKTTLCWRVKNRKSCVTL